jgi:hypothetical protein
LRITCGIRIGDVEIISMWRRPRPARREVCRHARFDFIPAPRATPGISSSIAARFRSP